MEPMWRLKINVSSYLKGEEKEKEKKGGARKKKEGKSLSFFFFFSSCFAVYPMFYSRRRIVQTNSEDVWQSNSEIRR